MQDRIQLLDVVALVEDVPEYKLSRGQVGTVVEELSPESVLVEFCDDQGKTYAMCGLAIQQLMGLHFEPSEAQASGSSLATRRLLLGLSFHRGCYSSNFYVGQWWVFSLDK